MACVMPKTPWDLNGTRLLCDHVRKFKNKPSRRDPPFAAFQKFLGISVVDNKIGRHMSCKHADTALLVYQEFTTLYTDLNNLNRDDLSIKAVVEYGQPATQAQVA